AINNPSSVKFIKFRYDPNNKNSLSDNRIISGYKDSEGNLWFGTYGGGLNELIPDQQNGSDPAFISYKHEQGLASNVVYCILGDDAGNLWISTDNGLSMFNPKEEIFKNYDVTDGLQGNQFFWGAGYKGREGELLFGGTNGFNAFNPSDLKNNTHVPPVVITDFKVLNLPVEIGAEGSPLLKAISLTKEIELSYSQNVFSFEFSALDYSAPNKNMYAYIMEGFDKNWIYSGNRRFITYTNLDPGKYIFKVIGSNNDGVWNKTGTQLAIIISPPFWRTWWFLSSAVIIVGGMIYLIIYYKVKNLIGIERLRAKLAADLHDNIGSSLTEISILSEVISHKIDSADDNTKKSLKMISDNSRNLIDSMSDIVWLVNPKRDSLYDLILRLRDTYSELSSYTNISFRSENIKELEKISLSMEHRQHLYLIFKEAINNSINHSKCSQIILDASVKGKRLEMTLKDDGTGFEDTYISSGNGLSNMKERAKSIGGVLSIFSEQGNGTVVQFNGNVI
ncbi:MAG: triple tyrosine motif-containing protein, partial [Ignavibacteriaceae bacterium]